VPLVDGGVRPEGVDLEWEHRRDRRRVPASAHEERLRPVRILDSHYIANSRSSQSRLRRLDRGTGVQFEAGCSCIQPVVREAAGIRNLTDLRGKGAWDPDFTMTGGSRSGIILKTLYGIHPREITWINTRPAGSVTIMRWIRSQHGDRHQGDQYRRVHHCAADAGARELDAAVGAPEVEVGAAPGIRHFPREAMGRSPGAVQRAIGITPVNHTLIVQKRLLVERPISRPRMLQGIRALRSSRPIGAAAARAILPNMTSTRNVARS